MQSRPELRRGFMALPKVLFITRKHPPRIGGMERQSAALVRLYRGPKEVVALSRSQRHLAWFLPYAFVLGVQARAKGFELIHIGDSLLAPLGALLMRINRVPVVVTAHGLDVTARIPFYQRVIPAALRSLDCVICVSDTTRDLVVARNVRPERCVVIPNGAEAPAGSKSVSGFELGSVRESTNFRLSSGSNRVRNHPMLLTLGRLVERKGHHWFVSKVLPALDSAQYVIIGSGPMQAEIIRRAQEVGVGHRVLILGQLPDEELVHWFKAADVFVAPNLEIEDDPEGFGLSVVEAGLAGLPVVATAVRGLSFVINDGQNGILCPPGDERAMVQAIEDLLHDSAARLALSKSAKKYNEIHFSWPEAVGRYEQLFCALAAGGSLRPTNGTAR